MSARGRLSALVLLFAGTVLAALAFGTLEAAAAPGAAPSSSGSYPPGGGPSVSLNKSTAAEGSDVIVTGHGFAPGSVSLALHTATYPLGTATANGNGSYTQQVTLPDGVTGDHRICGTNSAGTACADITITGSGTGGQGGGGGVSNTGVAVMGIGGVGVLLLLGGAVLLLAGRRSRAHA